MKADNISEQILAVVLDALADIKAVNVLSLDVRSLTGSPAQAKRVDEMRLWPMR